MFGGVSAAGGWSCGSAAGGACFLAAGCSFDSTPIGYNEIPQFKEGASNRPIPSTAIAAGDIALTDGSSINVFLTTTVTVLVFSCADWSNSSITSSVVLLKSSLLAAGLEKL